MTQPALASPSTFQRWILATRPKTLPASISPVLVGWGIAFGIGKFEIFPALAALVVGIAIQIGTNLINDVLDFLKGTDTKERMGPLRVTLSGLLTPRQVWAGVAVSYGAAALAGLYLAFVAGWQVILLGVVCMLAGFFYTAGKYSFTNIGLGDLFALLLFGLGGVCGTTFVIAREIPLQAWMGGIAAGALVTNILIVNNIRDVITDRKAGRKNIALVFGRKAAEGEYIFMLVLAYAIPLILLIPGRATPWILLPILSIPVAVRTYIMLHSTPSSPQLNPILAGTAQVLLVYSLLFALGLAIQGAGQGS